MKVKGFTRFWAALFESLLLILGAVLGYYLLPNVWTFLHMQGAWTQQPLVNIVIGLAFFFVIILLLRPSRDRIAEQVEMVIRAVSISDILLSAFGIILGLIIAWLINLPLIGLDIQFVSNVLPIFITIAFAALGFGIMRVKRDEVRRFFSRLSPMNWPAIQHLRHEAEAKEAQQTDDAALVELLELEDTARSEQFQPYKILDTSAIIDGRILGALKAGFIEGVIVVPHFVLKELQFIADSADSSKRIRGRRGLDILNAIQALDNVTVAFYSGDFDEEEVDLKLLMLAHELNGVVITTDYNLNKVSQFQKIKVLNVNELANAVKAPLFPGDRLTVTIKRPGTERRQGVGYMDDGTMIVVEDTRHLIGKDVDVEVTSAIQTNAGKMIFAKPTKQ